MEYPSPDDIAEMKARGYDPAAIAEAERRSGRRAAAEQVCQTIDAAFARVKLGGGVGLREAQGLDDYADAAYRAAYRAGDEKEDWHRIPAKLLNQCYSSLSFFDARGMRFHLPAYLIAALRGDYGHDMAFCLTHLSDYGISQFALLSPIQRAAVRTYLLHILSDPDEEFYHADIVRALAGFWTDPPPARPDRTA